MQKIGVLGAGTMGAGIAQTFAAAGLNVVLRDVSEDLVSGGLNIVKKISIDRWRKALCLRLSIRRS